MDTGTRSGRGRRRSTVTRRNEIGFGSSARRSGRARTGRAARYPVSRASFLPRTTRQMKRTSLTLDWLGGAAMLLAVASWGVLASLLG